MHAFFVCVLHSTRLDVMSLCLFYDCSSYVCASCYFAWVSSSGEFSGVAFVLVLCTMFARCVLVFVIRIHVYRFFPVVLVCFEETITPANFSF